MNAEELLMEKIRHQINMELLRDIGEQAGVDLTKEIDLAEKKFNNKLDRAVNGMTNDNIHKTNE
jgi:hypothetical protein